MRILLFNHFPLEGSGSGTYTRALARTLAEAGHHVAVLIPHRSGHPVCAPPSVQVFSIPCGLGVPPDRGLPFEFACFTTHPHSSLQFSDLSNRQIDQYQCTFARRLEQAATAFAPDVVHCQHVWMTAWAAAEVGLPSVVTCHGTDLMGLQRDRRYAPIFCRGAGHAHAIVALSVELADRLRADTGAADLPVAVIPNAVDTETFSPRPLTRCEVLARLGADPDADPLIVYAGKLTHFKGVDVLLEAAARYQREWPRAATVIAGDGHLRAPLEEQARRLGLTRVWFVGQVAQEHLAELFSVATLSVLPSRQEPFGLAAVESLACATPVLASDVSGPRQFIDDEVGGLVPPDDPEAWSAAILRLVRSGRGPAMGQAGLLRVRRDYTWSRYVERIVPLYRSGACAD